MPTYLNPSGDLRDTGNVALTERMLLWKGVKSTLSREPSNSARRVGGKLLIFFARF